MADKMTVDLLQELRQYKTPDTTTPFAGKLAPGVYEALAVEQRGADQYVLVGTWICAKSGTSIYAVVNGSPVAEGIDEQALVTMLQKFRGYNYSLNNPRYTSPIPNVSGLPLEPPKQNSCCVFVEDLVVHGFTNAGWRFEWNLAHHSQAMVADWNDLWSPPHAFSEAGLARPTVGPSTSMPLPQPWTICQGWGPSSGHTFIVLAVHAPTGKVLILESNSAYGFSGPGLRGLGDLDGYLTTGPPADWWTKSSVPTWAKIQSTYSTGLATAQLLVKSDTLVWGRSTF